MIDRSRRVKPCIWEKLFRIVAGFAVLLNFIFPVASVWMIVFNLTAMGVMIVFGRLGGKYYDRPLDDK